MQHAHQPRHGRPHLIKQQLAAAVLQGLACMSLASPLLLATSAVQAAQQQLDFAIPAGALGNALAQFGETAHLLLSYPAELTEGRTTQGLNGRFEVDNGLAVLLAGTDLEALRSTNGGYQIARRQNTDVLQLDALSISGKAPGSTTEGSGSYTTLSSSSSTRLNLTPKETPQSLTVMTRQRLDDQRLTTLSDTMDATPGIIVLRDGLGAESDSFWSRGFEIQNFEIDGVPTVTRMDNYAQSMAQYDRVEVVRGATGLISGMGNPSATINLIRKRPTAEAQASVTGEAGTWDRYGSGFDVSGPLTESGNVRGRVVADYKTGGAWVDRFKQDSQLLYGISEFDLTEQTLLTLGFSYLRTDVDSPLRSGLPTRFPDGQRTDLSRSTNASPDWSHNDHQQTSYFTSIEQQLGNGWSGKVEFTHTENKFDEVFTYLNGTLQTNGSGTSLLPVKFAGTPRQDNLDLYLTGPLSLLGREHEIIGGLTLSKYNENVPSYGGWRYDYSGSPAGAIDNLFDYHGNNPKPDFPVTGKSSIDETQYAAYLTGRFHVSDDLSLILGGRLVDWKRDTEDRPYGTQASETQSRETGVFIPYTGVVYDLNEVWSLYASYTKIFNPQASWVRDENNKPLDPMEGTGYEVGIKGSHYDGQLNSSLALFKLEQDNLAVWQAEYPGSNVYKSEQDTTSQGMEMQLDGQLLDGWQVGAGYAYTVTTDADDQRINTTLPRHSLKTFSTYRLGGDLDKLTVGGGVNWQSKVGSDLQTFTQGSYAITNLLARYDISKNLSASLNLNNLFDREYYSYAGYYGNYGAPRNLMTSFKYNF
ncbi:TonB-dependent siderophore receptor [Pseudomonas sp. P5_152]|uniref:TonB-dependent siderophore receptor n=1 Tax=Pseudomonas sp. P5_152 TaxID=3043442 RepID=UPI0039B76AD0